MGILYADDVGSVSRAALSFEKTVAIIVKMRRELFGGVGGEYSDCAHAYIRVRRSEVRRQHG